MTSVDDLPPVARKIASQRSITAALIRISAGLENVTDILNDIEQALAKS